MRRIFTAITAFVLAVATPVVLSAASAILFATPAEALDTNNFNFESYTADYYLTRDEDGTSRMRVIEELVAIFPDFNQNHGITRVIPFTNNNGKNVTMASTSNINLKVTRNGYSEPWEAHAEEEDGYFEIRIGSAASFVHGRQVYTLEYEFENLILDQSGQIFDGVSEWQELYWDANGNDWRQPFAKVTARVHLGEGIQDAFLPGALACYVGTYGENGQERCYIETTSDGFSFTALSLRRYETLTFVVGFNAGAFNSPVTRYSYTNMIALGIELILVIATIVLMVLVWRSSAEKRAFYSKTFVKPEYTPHSDFTVAELAENYMGKGIKGDPKVATLLELAVSHKIALIKTEKARKFGGTKTVWQIKVLDTNITKEQSMILQILKGKSGQIWPEQIIEIKSHTANADLQGLLTQFNSNIKKNVKDKGLIAKTPVKNLSGWLTAVSIIWFIAIFVITPGLAVTTPSYIVAIDAGWAIVAFGVLGVTTGVIGLVIAGKVNTFLTHTEKGLEMSRYLEGLYLYIKMAETDRIKFLQSVKGADTTTDGIVKLYEKLLPYASLFGLEKSWLDELGHFYAMEDVMPPVWYIGIGAFDSRNFSTAMSAISTAAGTSITHSTTVASSSGGSGFSGGGGGGFSGGGGGGGGGGGW